MPAAVPYANFGNPQSLNLYSYTDNRPLSVTDLEGHCTGDECQNVKVAVTKVADPQMVQNVKLGDNKYLTGVAGNVDIKFTDSKGPMAGMKVTESNTPSGGKTVENPNPVKTDKQGVITDVVAKGHIDSTPSASAEDLQDAKAALTSNPVTVTSTQTLTFKTTDSSGNPTTCQTSYSRTLTNVDASGNVSTQTNSNGVNNTLTTNSNQPVVKRVQQ